MKSLSRVQLFATPWTVTYQVPPSMGFSKQTYWSGLPFPSQLVKNLPAIWETWVRSLGREDLLEKEMATHSSILAWRIPWMEELGGLQSTGCKELDTTEQLHFHFTFTLNGLVVFPTFFNLSLNLAIMSLRG